MTNSGFVWIDFLRGGRPMVAPTMERIIFRRGDHRSPAFLCCKCSFFRDVLDDPRKQTLIAKPKIPHGVPWGLVEKLALLLFQQSVNIVRVKFSAYNRVVINQAV